MQDKFNWSQFRVEAIIGSPSYILSTVIPSDIELSCAAVLSRVWKYYNNHNSAAIVVTVGPKAHHSSFDDDQLM